MLFSQSSVIMGVAPQGGVSRVEAKLRSGVDSREKAPESYPEATESEEKYLCISSNVEETQWSKFYIFVQKSMK